MPFVGPASPSTANYQIAKGIITIKIPPVTGAAQLLGNVSKAVYSQASTLKEHYSGSAGAPRVRDFIAVDEVKATIALTLDEITSANLVLAVTGTEAGAGNLINILAGLSFNAEVLIVGTNQIGRTFNWDLFNVLFLPAKQINLDSTAGDFTELEIEGQVLIDGSGHYGTIDPTG